MPPFILLNAMQGISSILTGIATTVLAIEAIAGADAIIPFARGGIVPHAASGFFVPGNDHMDRTLIAAQSGELILNRAQQGNLASQLQAPSGGGAASQPYVSGENIFLGMSNYLKRSGRGEIVTTKR